MLVERRILLCEGIAASGQDDAVAITPFANDAMGPEAAFAQGRERSGPGERRR